MYARYVSPLFYKRKTLTSYDYAPPQIKWAHAALALHNGLSHYHWNDYVLLPESITIIPHEIVLGASPPNYTYNERGEIAFHSEPVARPQGRWTFNEFILNAARDSTQGDGYSIGEIVSVTALSISSAELGNRANDEEISPALEQYGLSQEFLSKCIQGLLESGEAVYALRRLSRCLLLERGIVCALGTISK